MNWKASMKRAGVHEAGVVLGQVGSHLQRGVEGDIEAQLVADGVTHLIGPTADLLQVHLKDTGCEVHRSTLQACEGIDGGLTRVDAGAELVAHSALVADHVGPRAAQSRRTHCLVGVDHDVVLGGLGDGIVVVVDQGLAIVILAIGDNAS